MIRPMALAAASFVAFSSAHAASLDDVSMPDAREVNGVRMQLNGIGLRTFSLLGIRIYVAGLYLEHRSKSPDEILGSPSMKLLEIHFLRDVDAEQGRRAWQESFDQVCKAPCYLDPHDTQRFLAAVPSVRKGDESTLLFTAQGLHITINAKSMGDVRDPHFAELILGTFIGAAPPTPRLKLELLGLRD
jgi:hypothetical protein